MDIILAVVQEVRSFSVVNCEPESVSDRVEFLQGGEKQKHAHCDDVQVESDDFIAQPGHNLG